MLPSVYELLNCWARRYTHLSGRHFAIPSKEPMLKSVASSPHLSRGVLRRDGILVPDKGYAFSAAMLEESIIEERDEPELDST